jgi:hypothetical protein
MHAGLCDTTDVSPQSARGMWHNATLLPPLVERQRQRRGSKSTLANKHSVPIDRWCIATYVPFRPLSTVHSDLQRATRRLWPRMSLPMPRSDSPIAAAKSQEEIPEPTARPSASVARRPSRLRPVQADSRSPMPRSTCDSLGRVPHGSEFLVRSTLWQSADVRQSRVSDAMPPDHCTSRCARWRPSAAPGRCQ